MWPSTRALPALIVPRSFAGDGSATGGSAWSWGRTFSAAALAARFSRKRLLSIGDSGFCAEHGCPLSRMGGMIAVKLPRGGEIASERLVFEIGAKQFHGHGIVLKNGVVEFAIRHLFRIDEFAMQGAK